MAELPEGKDRPHNVLGWMRALEGGVDKRVGAKQGRNTAPLFQLNVSTFCGIDPTLLGGVNLPVTKTSYVEARSGLVCAPGGKHLISVFGDDAELLFRPNVTHTTLGRGARVSTFRLDVSRVHLLSGTLGGINDKKAEVERRSGEVEECFAPDGGRRDPRRVSEQSERQRPGAPPRRIQRRRRHHARGGDHSINMLATASTVM
jgi:hypothetical protein